MIRIDIVKKKYTFSDLFKSTNLEYLASTSWKKLMFS